MKTKLFGIALLGATVAAVILFPTLRSQAALWNANPTQQTGVSAQAPRVEVVFVLDTTGSMGGLIDTAKEKIWSIATTMAQADPAPAISMGLVAYRDRGDAYVTRVVDLTRDLDAMYMALTQFTADGGGDGPESVNRALHDAIYDVSWSDDPQSYKVVFLVGDAPPHMDYHEARYPEIAAAAADRGIVINTIQCGGAAETIAPWRDIARLAGGRYMNVAQAGGSFAVSTPFDDQIARLSRELDDTRLYFGSKRAREAADSKAATTDGVLASASPAAQARRAVFKATASGAASAAESNELVDAVSSGRLALEDVPADELPEPLAGLSEDSRRKLIEEKAEKREALEGRIRELAEQRDAFIADKVEAAGGAAGSLDRQLYETVRDQAASKGLRYAHGPTY
jgi:Mg-chelatase subunit ChlD